MMQYFSISFFLSRCLFDKQINKKKEKIKMMEPISINFSFKIGHFDNEFMTHEINHPNHDVHASDKLTLLLCTH